MKNDHSMKTKDVLSIIVGGSITFLLWKILVLFIKPANVVAAFPCSMVGGYVAGRLRTNGIPSGAVSGLVAGFILIVYVAESTGEWHRSMMFGVIMITAWIIGGGLGELIYNVSNKK